MQVGDDGAAEVGFGHHARELHRRQLGIGIDQLDQAATADLELQLVELGDFGRGADLLLGGLDLQLALRHVGLGGGGLLVQLALHEVQAPVGGVDLLGGAFHRVIGTAVEERPVGHQAGIAMVADTRFQVDAGPARLGHLALVAPHGIGFAPQRLQAGVGLFQKAGWQGGFPLLRLQRHQCGLLRGEAGELGQRQPHVLFLVDDAGAHLQRARLGLHQLVATARIVVDDDLQVVDDLLVPRQVLLLRLHQLLAGQRLQVQHGDVVGHLLAGFLDLELLELLLVAVALDRGTDGTGRVQVELARDAAERRAVVAVRVDHVAAGLQAQHRPLLGLGGLQAGFGHLFVGTRLQHGRVGAQCVANQRRQVGGARWPGSQQPGRQREPRGVAADLAHQIGLSPRCSRRHQL